ncbi:hypothetical protein [Arthrobacter mangrovi]|uniref:YtxH domain-containing protein n=1 Tax=Arthrobacter mangrovi TaxID=2966350 RepID=A0ABQ5MTK4_9MICC|nr:hypothetical protein [Arthrobacter mangrovi]GLB67291.1 hypothetical protein AHIS1636_17310 [Arthrobacter mangrovi]
MMKKLLFGAGLATGFILGSKAGRGTYDQLAGAAGRIWRAKTGPTSGATSGPSGRRSADSAAPADAVRATPAPSGAARDQSGVDAAARNGQAAAGRRVGPDPSTDDRPGSEWSGTRAGSVETVGDPEEELGHS